MTSEDFYVGYRKSAPAKLARFIALSTSILVVIVLIAAVMIGAAQQPASNGDYDFGVVETFEGILRSSPLPHVEFTNATGASRAALLVGEGKHGMPDSMKQASGKRIRFGATRIERDGILMLEVNPDAAFEVLSDAPSPSEQSITALGEITVTGELVDTKCYLGVMNPGQGKVHRGCAAECLRGGVPAGLLVRSTDGTGHVLLLQPDATAQHMVSPEWAGRLVTATGSLESAKELPVMRFKAIELAR